MITPTLDSNRFYRLTGEEKEFIDNLYAITLSSTSNVRKTFIGYLILSILEMDKDLPLYEFVIPYLGTIKINKEDINNSTFENSITFQELHNQIQKNEGTNLVENYLLNIVDKLLMKEFIH